MNRSWYRIAGIYILLISVFLILGGIFIPENEAGELTLMILTGLGVILLIIGTLLYKIVKVEE